MRLFIILTCCAALLAVPALAQDTRDAELAFENDRLNHTYQAILQRLSADDRRGLRAAQRAWIGFRDADCAFGWGDRRDCLITRTFEREEQLRTSLYWDAQGNPIEVPEPPRLVD
jgi:uncharacterized protein YecT (DUF1311 family)